MTPRNIRNNNPLNIRRSKDQWQGLDAKQNDPSFFKFESMAMGWRAAFVILTKTYYRKYRLFTIRKIINRWAPSNENDTEAYIKKVSDLTGIDSEEPLGIPSLYPSRWMALGLAMAIVEGGRQPDVFSMMQGWTLARVGQ